MPAIITAVVILAFLALTIIFAILQLIAYKIRGKVSKNTSRWAKIYPYLIGYGMSIALFRFSQLTDVEVSGKEELVLIPLVISIFMIFFILNYRQK